MRRQHNFLPSRSRGFCFIRKPEILVALTLLFSIPACSHFAKVTEIRPLRLPDAPPADATRPVEQTIHRALDEEQRKPLVALGSLAAAAESALADLKRDPADANALGDYNFAVARMFTIFRESGLKPWEKPLQVGARGEYTLAWIRDPRSTWDPARFDFIPADQLKFRGAFVEHHVTKDGIGSPMVAYLREADPALADEFVDSPHLYYGVTALARFEGNQCFLAVENPLDEETTRVGGRTWPLAANFTASIALALDHDDSNNKELPRLFHPQKYAASARIARTEPYNPNKTVVLLVHGLASSPATWTVLLNELRGDPLIRDHYQFWFYSYPSGNPYPYSAAVLRERLDAIEAKFPLHKPMVVIGHSMGSLVSRLLITDSGEKLWMETIGSTPDQTPLSASSKKLLEDMLVFERRNEIGRVIFISGPHRGADRAENWIGRLSSSLIKAPATLAGIGKEIKHTLTADAGPYHLRRMPNSIDTLEPDDPLVLAINTLPLYSGVPYHTIAGDRGKGGNLDRTKPVSTDGVVPYWSSHLPGARSQKVVPSHHDAHRNPEGIAEVKRILYLHAGEK